jgi:hypothetical protein
MNEDCDCGCWKEKKAPRKVNVIHHLLPYEVVAVSLTTTEPAKNVTRDCRRSRLFSLLGIRTIRLRTVDHSHTGRKCLINTSELFVKCVRPKRTISAKKSMTDYDDTHDVMMTYGNSIHPQFAITAAMQPRTMYQNENAIFFHTFHQENASLFTWSCRQVVLVQGVHNTQYPATNTVPCDPQRKSEYYAYFLSYN